MIRILLDAKDLIELVERDKPMSVRDLSEFLRERRGHIVLTFVNVSEFADCFRGASDRLYIRAMLQALQALPVMYLHEGLIEVCEIEAAVQAFNASRAVNPHSPYVSRWDETTTIRGQRSPVQMIVGYRLDMMIFDLLGDREGQRLSDHRRNMGRMTRQKVVEERNLPPEERPKPRQALTDALQRKIEYWKLEKPKDMTAFGKWIYHDATLCPGFRLGWELFRSLVANVTDELQDTDVWDNAHFPAVPYVDHLTLDRRMLGYFGEVANRILKLTHAADYRNRAHSNLEELIQSLAAST